MLTELREYVLERVALTGLLELLLVIVLLELLLELLL